VAKKPTKPTPQTAMDFETTEFGYGGTKLMYGTLPDYGNGRYRLVMCRQDLEIIAQAARRATLRAVDTEFTVHGDFNPHHPLTRLVGISISVLDSLDIPKMGEIDSWYIPVFHEDAQIPLREIKDILGPVFEELPWSGHHIKVEDHLLWYAGIITKPLTVQLETMNAAGFSGHLVKDLKTLSETILKWPTLHLKNEDGKLNTSVESAMDQRGNRKLDFSQLNRVPVDMMRRYACHDSAQTVALAAYFYPTVSEMKQSLELRHRVVPELARMERIGLLVNKRHFESSRGILEERRSSAHRIASDIIRAKKLQTATGSLRHRIEKEVYDFKDSVVRTLLYDIYEMPILEYSDSGEASVGDAALTGLEDLYQDDAEKSALLDSLGTYKDTNKILTTFMLGDKSVRHPLSYIGRIFTTLNTHVARTGRLSSSSPFNAQNLPVRKGPIVRQGVIAPNLRSLDSMEDLVHLIQELYAVMGVKEIPEPLEWLWFSADMSQIEPRIIAYFAWLTGDDTLVQSYREGKDIYKTIGAFALRAAYETVVGEFRKAAKALVLGLAYGLSAFGIVHHPMMQILKPTKEMAEQWVNSLNEAIPSMGRYQLTQVWKAIKKGYVETLWGTRRYLDHIRSDDPGQRSEAIRRAKNHAVQGTNADVMLAAIIWIGVLLDKYHLRHRIIPCLTVHDELDSLVRADSMKIAEALFRHCLQSVIDLKAQITIDVEVGVNWGDLVTLQAVPLPDDYPPNGDNCSYCKKKHEHTAEQHWKGVQSVSRTPQAADTDDLIAAIQSEPNPFANWTEFNMVNPEKLADMPMKEWDLYIKGAEALGVPINEETPYLQPFTANRITGYVFWTGQRESQKGTDYATAKIACRDRYVRAECYSPGILNDGFYTLQGYYTEKRKTFIVKSAVPVTIVDDVSGAIHRGEVMDLGGTRIRGDLLHQLVHRFMR